MPKSKQQLRFQWIKPILEKQMSIVDILKVCPFSERTIKYWLERYHNRGINGLLDLSTKPHTSPNKTSAWIEEEIARIRKDKEIGGKKIYWELKKQYIQVSERTVNNILKRNGLTRIYRHKREYIYRKKPLTIPGKLIEIDIKYGVHFGFGRWWYQYTAIDVASRWRYLQAFENRQNDYSIKFLNQLKDKTKYMFPIKGIKTDNDPVFTNRLTGYEKSTDPLNARIHAFDIWCKENNIIHYLIEPGKPTQNGCVERSHRSDQQYFYRYLGKPNTIEEYNYKLRLWNNWYNDLPHCGLNGLSPNEYLRKVQNVLA